MVDVIRDAKILKALSNAYASKAIDFWLTEKLVKPMFHRAKLFWSKELTRGQTFIPIPISKEFGTR